MFHITSFRVIGFLILASFVITACNVDVTIDGQEEEDTPSPTAAVATIDPTPTAEPTPEPAATPTPAPTVTPAPEPTPAPAPTATPEPAVGAGDQEFAPLYPIREGNEWGFINHHGDVVIEPQWSRAWPFRDGYARIRIGSHDDFRYGFVDANADVRIFDDLEYVDDFSEGLAPFATDFEELHMWYPSNATWGYIDADGNTAIEPQFDGAGGFNDGLAPVNAGQEIHLIDHSGETVFDPGSIPGNPAFRSFTEELKPFHTTEGTGYIDLSGEVVIEPREGTGYQFSEGLAAFNVNDEYGFIDRDGNIVIEPQFVTAGEFGNNLAPVCTGTPNVPTCGYIDYNGNVVIDFQFVYAGPFEDGLAAVVVREDEDFMIGTGGHPLEVHDGWGYIDTSGEFIWPQE